MAYHNHALEFQSSELKIHCLIENADPKLVSFVFDAGHSFRAGADVPTFIPAHAGRVEGVLLCDSKAGGEVP